MEGTFETKFIKTTAEKTPFTDIPTQNFFAEWCKINDSIAPKFITRKDWKERGDQKMLEDGEHGKKTLFLPEDLHLWEMMDVIKTVDNDTFTRIPEKREEGADRIEELGKTFEKAGLYLSEHLPILGENERQIAENIASAFYQYGLSLQNKEQVKESLPQEITLSAEDETMLDEWFLGKKVYEKRLEKLGENPTEEQREELRKQILKRYFETLTKEGYREEAENPRNTKIGPAQHLQDRTKARIIKAMETPEREMEAAIFRRGVEKLVTEMKKPDWLNSIQDFLKERADLDLAIEKSKLYNTLEIPRLKEDLEALRKTGNLEEISAKELEIAKKIQKEVSSFPYERKANFPSKMVENQFINCVGSSVLGGGLLDDLKIKYLHASVPEHSATVLLTSDGKMYWQDFTPRKAELEDNFKEITPDMLGPDEAVSISSSITNLDDSGISISFKDWNPYVDTERHLRENVLNLETYLQRYTTNNEEDVFIPPINIMTIKGRLRVHLSKPEIGLQSHVLNNTGTVLARLGMDEEATKAFKSAIDVDPNYAYPHIGLGNSYWALRMNKEALKSYAHATKLDPTTNASYNGLGNVSANLGKYEEALGFYNQAILHDPEDALPHNGRGNALTRLGRYEEAIKEFQEFIKIWESWEGDKYWTDVARGKIKELEKLR